MTIEQLALDAINYIAPLLAAEGGKLIAKEGAQKLWELIKKPFSSDKEKALLNDLETNPANQIVQGKVIGKLEEHLESNPEFLKELGELLSKVKTNDINISHSKNVNIGNVNTSGGDFRIGDN